MDALQLASHHAKHNNNIVLYEYFDMLYKESASPNVYICACGVA